MTDSAIDKRWADKLKSASDFKFKGVEEKEKEIKILRAQIKIIEVKRDATVQIKFLSKAKSIMNL